ncbi:hypothetical protein L227DRAFT_573389 [Lentinus tigrinus ALCF2SS1-6]|uniref:Uncharacterized protein n=1 Tax=Lentinus tigrinus ALCF2SS1-6 TaxID=1328759 RepID=A0A5C2SHW5_9APHY|nr:hypothetical protein L227DRAFT_573389 [Lentinus tigrinus ALCF2SS1-6]
MTSPTDSSSIDSTTTSSDAAATSSSFDPPFNRPGRPNRPGFPGNGHHYGVGNGNGNDNQRRQDSSTSTISSTDTTTDDTSTSTDSSGSSTTTSSATESSMTFPPGPPFYRPARPDHHDNGNHYGFSNGNGNGDRVEYKRILPSSITASVSGSPIVQISPSLIPTSLPAGDSDGFGEVPDLPIPFDAPDFSSPDDSGEEGDEGMDGSEDDGTDATNGDGADGDDDTDGVNARRAVHYHPHGLVRHGYGYSRDVGAVRRAIAALWA